MSLVAILLFGCLLALANLAGGALVILPPRVRGNASVVGYIVALGAGFMLAAVFLEVLPQVVATWYVAGDPAEEPLAAAMSIVLCGYLSIHLLEHVLASHGKAFADDLTPSAKADLQSAPESEAGNGLRATTVHTALAGLFVHTFFDGVTIATGFIVDLRFGMLVFLAVLLHKLPEGMTAASIALAGGRRLRPALIATAGVASATLLGVLAVLLLPFDVALVIRYALPFSAGVTLYIVASDLIPEITRRRERQRFATLAIVGGVLLFYLLHTIVSH